MLMKVINLQKALCDYLEGRYPDINMEDTYLFRRCYYITNSHPKKKKKNNPVIAIDSNLYSKMLIASFLL